MKCDELAMKGRRPRRLRCSLVDAARVCAFAALATMGMTAVVHAKTTAWIGSGDDALVRAIRWKQP